MRSVLFITIYLVLSQLSLAQNAKSPLNQFWNGIFQLETEGKFKSALDKIDSLRSSSTISSSLEAKTFMFRAKYRLLIEEDARLSVKYELDSLIGTRQKPSFFYHFLRAKSLSQYLDRHRYSIAKRVSAKDTSDFHFWSIDQLEQAISSDFNSALENLEIQQVADFEFMIKEGYKNQSLDFDLKDLISLEALDFYKGLGNPNAQYNYDWFNWSSFKNADLSLPLNQLNSEFSLYQQIIAEALADEKGEIATFFEIKRLERLKSLIGTVEAKEWVEILERTLINNQFDAKAILLRLAKTYHRQTDAGEESELEKPGIHAHKWANEILTIDSTSFEAIDAQNIIESLESKELNFVMQQYQPVDRPSKFFAEFRNIDSVQFKIYRCSYDQVHFIKNFEADINDKLERQKFVRSWTQQLPNTSDYLSKSTELLLKPLPHGLYVMAAFNAKSGEYLSLTDFQVSDVNYIQLKHGEKSEVLIADRSTGSGIAAAKVIFDNPQFKGTYTSDPNGRIYLPAGRNLYGQKASIISNNDTTYIDRIHIRNNYDRFLKEETAIGQIFTDRAIYRPGQTVFFKGYVYGNKYAEQRALNKFELLLTAYDANYEEILIKKYLTNQFGTFSDSLQLPKNILPGRFTIKIDQGNEENALHEDMDYSFSSSTSFSVENYKRPKFEIEIEDIKPAFVLGDTIVLNQTAKLFSGGNLTNGMVSYQVNLLGDYYRDTGITQVANGEVTTDENGKFVIRFGTNDFSLLGHAKQLVKQYEITGVVTDRTGESHEFSRTVSVANYQVVSSLFVKSEILKTDKQANVKITTNNLNGQKLPFAGKLEVYKLSHVGSYPITRNWEVPSSQVMDKDSFNMFFPYEQYTKEQVKKELIFEAEKHKDSIQLTLPITNWKSGRYELLFIPDDSLAPKSATRLELKEDSHASHTREFIRTSKDKEAYQPGDMAKITFSSDVDGLTVYVIPDKYAFEKPEYVLELKGKSKSIKVPIKEEDQGGFTLHYIALGHNYSKKGSVEIDVPVLKIPIGIYTETFRDLVEPGMQEEWTFTIKDENSRGVSAELLANMYDNSLDQFAKHEWRFRDQYLSKFSYSSINAFADHNKTTRANTRYRNFFMFNSRINPSVQFFGYSFANTEQAQNRYLYEWRLALQPSVNIIQKDDIADGHIQGRVVGEIGEGLPQVTILLKGTNTGVTTDKSGFFDMEAEPGQQILVRYLGYKSITFVVGKGNYYNIELAPDIQALSEVVVTGHGVELKRSISPSISEIQFNEEMEEELAINLNLNGAVAGVNIQKGNSSQNQILIRGNSSTNGQNMPLYVVDGVPLSTAFNIDPNTIDKISVLKGREATALYGAAAKNGVVIITTKQASAKINALLDNVVARTNLSESAFFFPHLRTAANGEVSFSFKTPEALTRWKLMLLAHTKSVQVKQMVRTVTTQKKLMVAPNWPRFYRVGDQVNFTAKVINLTERGLQANVRLQFHDSETNEVISNLIPEKGTQQIKIESKSDAVLSWTFEVPDNISDLKMTVVAAANDFSDGESQVLAVLPNKELITQTQPFWVNAEEEISLETFQSLHSKTAQPVSMSLEITENPLWNVLSNLPYLIEYPYECSEQTFARIFANSLGIKLIDETPELASVIEKVSLSAVSALSEKAEMKQLLLEETPWLREGMSQQERMSQLKRLLQTDSLRARTKADVEKLKELQLSDGAFPWFSGGYKNVAITNYIVQGFRKMESLGISLEELRADELVEKAQSFLINSLYQDYIKEQKNESRSASRYTQIDLLYTLSLDEAMSLSTKQQEAMAYVMQKADSTWLGLPLALKAKLAMAHSILGSKEQAQIIFESLHETAIIDQEKGMFWKSQSGHSWYNRNLIAHNNLMELYDKMASDSASKEAQFKWLLQQKRKTDWGNTRATTQSIYTLLQSGYSVGNSDRPLSVSINEQPISMTSSGLYQIKEWPKEEIVLGQIAIENKQNSPKWGSLSVQYYENASAVKRSGEKLQIERKMFIDRSGKRTEIDQNTVLQTGDRVFIELLISADDDFDYMHIKDSRTAALEPTDVLSGYRSFGGLWAYQSNGDASMNFFADRLPKGKYIIKYEMIVNQSGTYANGFAKIQSMYAPEFRAISDGSTLKINPRN